jgi:hypothetical protein
MKRQFLLAPCIILSSCGYSFQSNKNPLAEVGIQKIYIQQFKNETFRPGVEQIFSSAMVREFQKSGAFRLVNSEDEADAILAGTVIGVDSSVSSSRTLDIGDGKQMEVGSQFNGNVNCEITLKDRKGKSIFAQSIAGSKIFPGGIGLRDEGATISLINESEHRLAIQNIASQMMASVYQRMVDTF